MATGDAGATTLDQMPVEERRRMARIVSLAAMIGTAIEFYDFFIYGTAASLIFREQFFPNMTPVVGTAVSVATFAVGYISRPVGAAVLSNFGDKFGRRNMLILSMMTMGLSTTLIGLLPNAGSIGMAAPILLIFLRLCQGFGVGAEQGGALVMATEFAPNGRRGLFAGLAGCGVALGLLMANLGFLTLNSLSDPGWVKEFGWRIPFLFSLVLVGVGLWLRLHVDETPAFKNIIGTSRQKSVPFVQLLVKNWPNLLQIVTLTLFLTAIGYTGLVFAVAYASSRLGIPSQVLLACGMVANLLEIPATIFFASLSDRIGRKKVFLTAVAIGIAFAFVFFQLIDTKSILAIGVALAGLRLITAGMYGPQGAIFAEMFDTEVRFSGVAVGLGVGNIVSALIVSTLFASTGGSPWGPTLFMAGAGVVSFISGMTLKDRRSRDMADTTTA